jgi:hypothetical protein
MSNEIVPVPVSSLAPIDYQGQRVVTLSMVDQVHGRPKGTARRAFNTHKDKMVEGRHYFAISQPNEIRSLGLGRADGSTPAVVNILSEFGYFVLVKSFTDNRSWQVQEQLVDGYFRGAELAAAISPSFALETLTPAMASQIGGIVKAVSRKQHEESEARMVLQFEHAVAKMEQDFESRFKAETAAKLVSIRRGKTSGELWVEIYKLAAFKGSAVWFSGRLCDLKCDTGERSESGGIPSKLFDPDKVAAVMKGGLLSVCRLYVARRSGQGTLFPMPKPRRKKK